MGLAENPDGPLIVHEMWEIFINWINTNMHKAKQNKEQRVQQVHFVGNWMRSVLVVLLYYYTELECTTFSTLNAL